MIKTFHANQARLRRHQRMRRRLKGSPERPRLNVFRSGQHIYAQIIDDASGKTLVAASTLEEGLRGFKPGSNESLGERVSEAAQAVVEAASNVLEAAASILPLPKGKGAKNQPQQQGKGKAQSQQKGRVAQVKTVLPTAERGAKRTPAEALEPIANNRKVAQAREVGRLLAQRAQEKGVSQVVFDRGGYTYHGRIASLAEGAREAGLKF